MRLDTDHTV